LIREFKALSATGVLRLGGNTSEFAYGKPAPDSPEPEHPEVREVTGEPKAQYYAVTVAPSLDSREAHITTSTKTDSLKKGKCTVLVPRATGLRLTVI